MKKKLMKYVFIGAVMVGVAIAVKKHVHVVDSGEFDDFDDDECDDVEEDLNDEVKVPDFDEFDADADNKAEQVEITGETVEEMKDNTAE